MGKPHITVLKTQLVEALNLSPGDWAIDCTAGFGGHTELMLDQVGSKGKVFAFDRDLTAMAYLKQRFADQLASHNLILIQRPFADLKHITEQYALSGKISGICADIGVSSPQLDQADRGFSLMAEGPLDMRMDQTQELSAYEVVNTFDKKDLIEIFRRFGEEPKAGLIASLILDRRMKKPITTTLELAELIEQNVHYKTKSRKHPATKVFQAIRIFVNDELNQLKSLCIDALETLKPNGRLSIISFHSLEDRIVKKTFQQLSEGLKSDPQLRRLPISEGDFNKLCNIQGRIIKPFPLMPSDSEIEENPRARSAKLRTIEKL